jgi:hypothetical protein
MREAIAELRMYLVRDSSDSLEELLGYLDVYRTHSSPHRAAYLRHYRERVRERIRWIRALDRALEQLPC